MLIDIFAAFFFHSTYVIGLDSSFQIMIIPFFNKHFNILSFFTLKSHFEKKLCTARSNHKKEVDVCFHAELKLRAVEVYVHFGMICY